ncbi:MAG: branched-chain amino acid transport system substrate-binding protein [Glaciecola sp.]|jgi:branched-chain amino acid transport system substrate-binding protein
MQRSMWLRRSAAVTALALGLTACAGDGDGETTDPGTDSSTPDSTTTDAMVETDGILTIGTILPNTGDLAVLGPAMTEASKLAVQQINDAGGVLGVPVVLAEGDSGTNEDIANATADRLIQSENVDAVVGAASSRITLSIIDKITGAGIVECSPSNTGASLSNYESSEPGFYFRTAPPDNLQGPALANVIAGDGFTKVTIIALNDEYGQGFAAEVEKGLVAANIEVSGKVAYDPNGADFAADVQTAVGSGAEAYVLIAFPDTGAKILAGMLEANVDPTQIFTADGMQGDAVIAQVDPNNPAVLNGLKGTAPSSQGSEQFAADFTAFAPEGTPQIFSAHAYDCVNIIALAAAVAGTDDPSAIAAEMVGVTAGGTKCTTFAECIALVDAGTDIDYDGASGPGEWVGAGEPSAGTYDVWQFLDGGIDTIKTVDVA